MKRPLYQSERERGEKALNSKFHAIANAFKSRAALTLASVSVADIMLTAYSAEHEMFELWPVLYENVKDNPLLIGAFVGLAYGLGKVVNSDYLSLNASINQGGRLQDAIQTLRKEGHVPIQRWYEWQHDLASQQDAINTDAKAIINGIQRDHVTQEYHRIKDGVAEGASSAWKRVATWLRLSNKAELDREIKHAGTSTVGALYGLSELGKDRSVEGKRLRAIVSQDSDDLREILGAADRLADAITPYQEQVNRYFKTLASVIGEEVKYIMPALKDSFDLNDAPDKLKQLNHDHYAFLADMTLSAQRQSEKLLLDQALQQTLTTFSDALTHGQLTLEQAVLLLDQARSIKESVQAECDAIIANVQHSGQPDLRPDQQLTCKIRENAVNVYDTLKDAITNDLCQRLPAKQIDIISDLDGFIRQCNKDSMLLYRLGRAVLPGDVMVPQLPAKTPLHALQAAALDIATCSTLQERLEQHPGLHRRLADQAVPVSAYVMQILRDTHHALAAQERPESFTVLQKENPTPAVEQHLTGAHYRVKM